MPATAYYVRFDTDRAIYRAYGTRPFPLDPRGTQPPLPERSLYVLWILRSPTATMPRPAGKRRHSSGGPGPLVSGSAETPGAANRLSIPIRLGYTGKYSPIVSLSALVDSGAAVNLMDITLAKQLGIPTTPVAIPQPVQALDGRPLGSGRLDRITAPLIMSTQDGHQETIRFWLTTTQQDPVVLGYPWLAAHEPQFSWATSSLLHWGTTCTTGGQLTHLQSPPDLHPQPPYLLSNRRGPRRPLISWLLQPRLILPKSRASTMT